MSTTSHVFLSIILSGILFFSFASQPRIMALVRDHLVQELQPELNRWIDDLSKKGYKGFVKPWPDSLCETRKDNAHVKKLWACIQEEYKKPEKLQGAVLIGRYPERMGVRHYSSGKDTWYSTHDDIYLRYMDSFEPSPSKVHIWVSRVDALNTKGTEFSWGSEITLMKRYLQANHDHRSGKCRLPHMSYGAITEHFDREQKDGTHTHDKWEANLVRLYPAFTFVGTDERKAYDGGGEYFVEYSHGNTNSNQIYGVDALLKAPAQVRHNAMGSCGETVGGIATIQLFGRHGAITTGRYSWFHMKTEYMNLLIAGKTFGEAHIECPMISTGALLIGDWSLKPMMHPANKMPILTNVEVQGNAVTGTPTTFSIDAHDPDGSLRTIELYPEGWGKGDKEPVVFNYSPTFQYTFSKKGSHKIRIMVADEYKAWAWEDITVNVEQGPAFTKQQHIMRGGSRNVTVIAGKKVRKIPVGNFPAMVQLYSLSGRLVRSYTIQNQQQHLVLPNNSGVSIFKIITKNTIDNDFVVQY